MAECPSCPSCHGSYEKNPSQRSYRRTKLTSLYTPKTRKELFPSLTEDDFICHSCSGSTKHRTTTVKGSRKRRLSFTCTPKKSLASPGKLFCSPRAKRPDHRDTPIKEGPSRNVKKAVIYAINRSEYKKAIRHVIRNSMVGRKAVESVITDMLRSEVRKLKLDRCPFSQAFTFENLEQFQWKNISDYLEEQTPLVSAVLSAIFPPVKTVMRMNRKGRKHPRPLNVQEARDVLRSRIGMTMGVALYTSSPKKFKFLQTCIGVEMWGQGCSQKTFSTLNKFGFSQGVGAARAQVDRVSEHHADQISKWKSSMENEQESRGFSLGWDNVQISSEARHQGKGDGRENRFLLWALSFGTENRVSTGHLTNTATIPASEVNPWSILPTPTDFLKLEDRMITIVERILVDHIPVLENVRVTRHISHEQTESMKTASKVVNLGVTEANPSSTEGVTRIMKELQKHLPNRDGVLVPVLCHGDNTSVERMRGSRRAAVNALTPESKLEGMEESPQEFHKEALLLQDHMNTLYSGRSLCARGTVSQLKVEFGHRSMKKKVMDNFKHSWDMMQFLTEAYILLLALKLRGMEDLDASPESFPTEGTDKEKQTWTRQLAMDIVDTCWLAPHYEDLRTTAEAYGNAMSSEDDALSDGESFPFCLAQCKTDKEEVMVLCCNAECPGEWFHTSCLGLDEPPHPDEDWYCSPSCANSPFYIYCVCKKKRRASSMVQCQLQSSCRRREWYHIKCLGLTEEELPDIWYCSDVCMLGAEDDDHVRNYSIRAVWEGLNILTRRDAVREGDGPAILSHWKVDMVQFWNKHHWKYFSSGCQMLTNVAGFLPERLQKDIVWNRLVNVKGKSAGNIGMDLLNEFLNNDFKEMLKRCRGRYTDLHVQRISRMSGAFARQLEEAFTDSGLGNLSVANYHEKSTWIKKDVKRFVTDYKDDALFDYCPPRAHSGFEGFVNSRQVHSPVKMGQKLHELTAAMDFWKDLRSC